MTDHAFKQKRYLAIMAVTLVFCIFYFIPPSLYEGILPPFVGAHRIAVPLLILTVAGAVMLPPMMTLAMLFSCIGDYMGSCHIFLAQMAGFALAHIMIICYFLSSSRKVNIVSTLVAAVIGISGFILIVPHIPAGVMRIGCSVYILLICTMLASALYQKDWIFAIGALLFVASDYILAWNKFVSPIAAEKYLIMVPYYLAQIFIWSGAWRDKYKTLNPSR